MKRRMRDVLVDSRSTSKLNHNLGTTRQWSVKVHISTKRNILDITEDCTRLVFDRLTLNQLIHLRAVCHAWNHIITQMCSPKRKIQIFFSNYSVKNYYYQMTLLNLEKDAQFQLRNKNVLRISQKINDFDSDEALKRNQNGSFSDQQNDPNLGIRFIARLFPNITNFVCIINHQRMFELNYILWKWSNNLDTLTLSYDPYSSRNDVSQNARQDFATCFQQLSSLKRLHLLDICANLNFPKSRTFGQLEEFSFNNPLVQFAPYFAQLEPKRFRILRLGDHYERHTPDVPDTNPELIISKLTHLSLNYYYSFLKHKFQNLIYLYIMNIYYSKSVADVLQVVVRLPKLQTLVLELGLFVRESEVNKFNNNPNYRHTFPIFHNTVTELRLMDNTYSYALTQFQEYQLLARIFPKVRSVQIFSPNQTLFTQIQPQISEAFGEQVEVKLCMNRFKII